MNERGFILFPIFIAMLIGLVGVIALTGGPGFPTPKPSPSVQR